MPAPRPPARRPLALAVGAVALLAALGAALVLPRGGDEDAGPEAEARLVFATFGLLSDSIYVAAPDALEERELVVSVPHARGWAITPAAEMAGALVAFTVLPTDVPPRREEPAELWLLDVLSGEQTRLAGDADLLAAPVLDRAGESLVYRRSSADGAQELVRVDLATRARRTLLSRATSFGLFPVAVDRAGAVLYIELSTGGTDLYRIAEGGSPQLVAHASDHVARDWRLSPDGATLSYLTPEISAERVVQRLRIIGVAGEAGTPPAAPVMLAAEDGAVLAAQFSPVWTPGGEGLTVGLEAYPELSAAPVTLALDATAASAAEPPLPAPAQGFDAPLGWSDDGRYLAARSFSGRDAFEPGRESLVVISPRGERATVVADSELIFLGWLQSV